MKNAIYRELRYGAVLNENVASDHIKLDSRLEPDSQQAESDYPWCIFAVVNEDKDDRTGVVKATVEFTLIGKMSGATKNDDLLVTIKDDLIEEFGGHRKTWGQYDEDGNADASEGLLMSAAHLDSTEGFDDVLDEKLHILMFRFAYVPE